MIEILDARVNWRGTFENDPNVSLLISREPEHELYKKVPCVAEQGSADQVAIVGRRAARLVPQREGWHIYWSLDDPLAWFFTWGGKPDEGFGRWRRTIKLEDGTEEEVVGGWHVGPYVATDVGLPATVGIAYHTERDKFERWNGGGGRASFVTEDAFREAVARLLPDVEVIEGFAGLLTVKWRGQIMKREHQAAEQARREPLREQLQAKYTDPDHPFRSWLDKLTEAERAEFEARPYEKLGPNRDATETHEAPDAA